SEWEAVAFVRRGPFRTPGVRGRYVTSFALPRLGCGRLCYTFAIAPLWVWSWGRYVTPFRLPRFGVDRFASRQTTNANKATGDDPAGSSVSSRSRGTSARHPPTTTVRMINSIQTFNFCQEGKWPELLRPCFSRSAAETLRRLTRRSSLR